MADRYRLVYHFKDGKTENFTLHFEDGSVRNKFSLTEIDALTTSYSNREEFEKNIQLIFPKFKDGCFSIEYTTDHETKNLELVFNDMNVLRKIALENKGNSKIQKSINFTVYFNSFLKAIEENYDFWTFLVSHRYVNRYFKEVVNNYFLVLNSKNVNEIMDAKNNIKKELSRYKTIRGIEIGKKSYALYKKGESVPSSAFQITVLERAKREYELNHPKKNAKRSKNVVDDSQLPLFDVADYTVEDVKKTKK